MNKIVCTTLALIVSLGAFSQNYNLRFKSKMTFNADLNDIWGVSHSSGNEYAIVGKVNGISVVDVTDPTNIFTVKNVAGKFSIWRDLKSYGNYAYSVTEANEGLTILNLNNVTAGDVTSKVFSDGTWSSSHNMFIDESNGRMYIFGADFVPGKAGVLVYDLTNDPYNPTYVGYLATPYCHDGFAKGNNLYLANINDGFFTIYDISNFSLPVLKATKSTPRFFTHNIWTNDSETLAFTTDEKSGAGISSYDISDKENPLFLDNIESDPEIKPIVHNVHVKGDYVITSYYSNGVTIHDASVPSKLAEVAYFDTSPFRNNQFNGAWGAFPFLNSGNILVSDIEEGLVVLAPDYLLALEFEGVVVDKENDAPLSNAQIIIKRGNHNVTNWMVNGSFSDRLASGDYSFEVSSAGYITKTVSVSSNNGTFPFTKIALEKSAVGVKDLGKTDLKIEVAADKIVVAAPYDWTLMSLYSSNGALLNVGEKIGGQWILPKPTSGVFLLKAQSAEIEVVQRILIK